MRQPPIPDRVRDRRPVVHTAAGGGPAAHASGAQDRGVYEASRHRDGKVARAGDAVEPIRKI